MVNFIRRNKWFNLLLPFLLFAFARMVPAAEPLRAKALQPGDTIMIVAPARTPATTKMKLAKQRLEAMGYRVKVPLGIFETQGYLAGSDERRAHEIMKAFSDPEVDAIFAGTGGFGTTRILDHLDYDVIRKNPKVFTGYSDITGLHLAINKKTSLITFHGPNMDSGLGIERNLTSFSAKWFFRSICGSAAGSGLERREGSGFAIRPFGFSHAGQSFDQPIFAETKALVSGKAQGRIVGGNLSLVVALMGTPYEIETKDAVLFLEDIGEAPYRVDRMMSTLKLAGKLDEATGIVLGKFTYRDDQDTTNEGQTVGEVLESYFANEKKPVITGFPFGHHACNATLPIGAMCEIDAESRSIRILEEPVRVAKQ